MADAVDSGQVMTHVGSSVYFILSSHRGINHNPRLFMWEANQGKNWSLVVVNLLLCFGIVFVLHYITS